MNRGTLKNSGRIVQVRARVTTLDLVRWRKRTFETD
jgi:hypothetical protein